jgi:hypothetical protein
MKTTPGCFSYPRIVYTALSVLTPASYVVSFVLTYRAPGGSRFLPLPATVVAIPPASQLFRLTSVAVVLLLFVASWRAHRGLTQSPRTAPKGIGRRLVIYFFSMLGFLAGCFYALMTYCAVTDNAAAHFVFHFSALICVSGFLLGVDSVIVKSGVPLDRSAYRGDIANVLLIFAYLFAVMAGTRGIADIDMRIVAVIGYLAIASVFGRYDIHGQQMRAIQKKKR